MHVHGERLRRLPLRQEANPFEVHHAGGAGKAVNLAKLRRLRVGDVHPLRLDLVGHKGVRAISPLQRRLGSWVICFGKIALTPFQCMCAPPSTTSVWPVMKSLSEEAK